MRPQTRLRAALLASSLLLTPALAAAAPAWTQMTSGTTDRPHVNGGTTVTATLGSAALPVTSIPSGALIVACGHTDANGGTHGMVDAAGDPWKLGPDSAVGGQAETFLMYTITTRALSTGDTITYTDSVGGFIAFDFNYLSGTTATPAADGASVAQFTSSNVSTAPSGSVTGSQPHDAAIGCATNKFGGGAQTQSAGFSTPPAQPTGGDSGYIAGTAIDTGTSAWNYSPNSAVAQHPLSSLVALFTTEPSPFQPHKPAPPVVSPFTDVAPDVAQAAGLTMPTYLVSSYGCSFPWTVDCSYDFNLGHLIYCASSFHTGCVSGSIAANGLSLTIKEADGNGGTYQDTAPTWGVGQAGGSSHVGKAFQGDFYAEATASFTSQDTTSGPTWYAPWWSYNSDSILPTPTFKAFWPGFPTIFMRIEIDWELFGLHFVPSLVNGYFSVHVHEGASAENDYQSQLVYTPACNCASYWQSPHRFGFKVHHATDTVSGFIEGFIDGVSVGQVTFTKLIYRKVAAASLSTSQSSLLLTTATPTSLITHGWSLIHASDQVNCGPINDYTASTVHLQSNSLCTGAASDQYELAPPPPTPITGGGYVSATGVETVSFGSDQGIAVGDVVSVSPVNTGPSLACNACTVIAVGTNSFSVQLPTGLGNTTITGGFYLPPWYYGAVDEQPEYFTAGYPDSSPGVEYHRGVWQTPGTGDDLNVQPF